LHRAPPPRRPAPTLPQAGEPLEFRRILPRGRCASGWQPGVLLCHARGSEWEGGWRLLVQPTGGAAAASPSGRDAGSPPAANGAHQGVAGSCLSSPGGSDGMAEPVWVPLLWRGVVGGAPFPAPVVLVRPPHALHGGSRPGASGSEAGAAKETSSKLKRAQHAACGASAPGLGMRAGAAVEVLRHGFWWPAVVVTALDAEGHGVVRNAAAPEGDGLEWHAAGQHPIR
jgi:hypothetical protein